jgi:hypothetical protein
MSGPKVDYAELQKLGENGWELVAVTEYYGVKLYFKRPKS